MQRYPWRRRSKTTRRVRVVLLAGLAGLAIAGASSQALAATSSGELYAVGLNDFGQLGSTTNVLTGTPNPTPALVDLPGASGPVTQAAVGQQHSLVVTSTGQLYAFGENLHGQLGIAATSGSTGANPAPGLVTLPGATGPVSEAAAGASFSLAITTTGQLYSFGENAYGQLGSTTNNGSGTANPTPTLVTLPEEKGPVTQVAAGDFHSLAITAGGQLYAFGRNYYGELGRATNNLKSDPNPTPTLVGLPGATGLPIGVATGETYSLVVTATGQLYSFGENRYGQLGNTIGNEKENEAHPTPTLVSLPGAAGPVTQVAAGAFHALALTATGQLYGFGSNYGGQLGNTLNNEASGKANPTPTLVSLPGASGPASQITASYGSSLAATSTGQLYGFGFNQFGQIGSAINNGTPAANPTPALVGFPTGTTVDALAQGPYAEHALVVASPSVPSVSTPPATTSSTTTTSIKTGGPAISVARIRAGLLAQLIPNGKGAKIAKLLKKKGYAMSFSSLAAGKLVIDWYYVPKGAHVSKKKRPVPVLVAAGRRTFARAGKLAFTVKLTSKGARMLGKAKRLKLTAKGVFTTGGLGTITATKGFTLAR